MKTLGNATNRAKEILQVVLHGKNPALGSNGPVEYNWRVVRAKTDLILSHSICRSSPFGALEAADIASAVVVEVSQLWPV